MPPEHREVRGGVGQVTTERSHKRDVPAERGQKRPNRTGEQALSMERRTEVMDCPVEKAGQPRAVQLRDTSNITYWSNSSRGSGVASGRGRQDVRLKEVLRGAR